MRNLGKLQRSYRGLCNTRFTKYLIIFIHSWNVSLGHNFPHWSLKIMETAILDFPASLSNKTFANFDFWLLLDVSFPFFPMLLNRLLNCFIQFWIIFTGLLIYFSPLKYEGFRFQIRVNLECKYILFSIPKHQMLFLLAKIDDYRTRIPQNIFFYHKVILFPKPVYCLTGNLSS